MPSGNIHLTFDDGPDDVWTPLVLDALTRTQAKATFFVVAPLAVANPTLVERMLSEEHGVALHCEQHIRHTELTNDEILRDTERGLNALDSLGVKPSCWRPPWGVTTAGTEQAARQFELGISLWNVDTHDWRGDSAAMMLGETSPALEDGATILMHDGLGPGAARSGCEETVALIPHLVSEARSLRLGATTLPISNRPERGVERSTL